jgi:copper chaperone
MQLELQVRGMSCQHCVAAVTKAVEQAAGVESAHVDLENGNVEVVGREGQMDRRELVEAIRAAGYEVS